MTFSNYLPHSSILISPCVNYACVIDCHASSGLICLVKITLHWLYYLHYIQPLHVGGNSFHQPRTSEQFYNLLQAIHFPNFVSVTDWFWRWKVKGKGSKKRGGGNTTKSLYLKRRGWKTFDTNAIWFSEERRKLQKF